MVSGSRLISQDNAEGFDVVGPALEDFIHLQNLALRALGLELVSQMVPEF